mgnify:CR=1 FL=1
MYVILSSCKDREIIDLFFNDSFQVNTLIILVEIGFQFSSVVK